MRPIGAAVALVALGLAGAACGPLQDEGASEPEDFARVYWIEIGDSPVKGNPNAPVTIVEFSDFQCPFCARTTPLIAQALERYGDQVRIVYKHFPLSYHRAAYPAALASLAAHDQGRFWEMHDVLFANHRSLSADQLEDYARQAGLDVERFRKDMEVKRSAYQERVIADYRQGIAADVRGTPTIYINGKKLRDRSPRGISAQIEAELNTGS